ncbi:EF-hand domain-containing protein [Enterobacter sp. 22466]|uniref:EF-hand domain-containing protein n=1 Tax=Enterobacter sp. 22466 TaxID=3453924 RepID=UPI003F84D6CC
MTEAQLRDMFSRTDTDNDGFITREEFISETMKLFEGDLSKVAIANKEIITNIETEIIIMRKSLEDTFSELDLNADGKLSLDEVLRRVSKVVTCSPLINTPRC